MLRNLGWKLTGGLAGAAAGWAARTGMTALWRKTTQHDPPQNPASRSTSWPEAAMWAVGSGVALGVARLVAERGAAGAWHAATGSYPAAVANSGART
jgi:hypothetical protein